MSLTFANKLTILRILSVPVFISSLLCYAPERNQYHYLAFGIFMFAVITDFVDGYIARTRDQKTKAGAILDPLADKLLLISAFVCLYEIGSLLGNIHFPTWLVVGVISRDVILLLGAMIIYLVHGDFDIKPSILGKAAAFFQICSVIGIFLQSAYSPILWFLTIIFTIISGFGYILQGIKILNSEAR